MFQKPSKTDIGVLHPMECDRIGSTIQNGTNTEDLVDTEVKTVGTRAQAATRRIFRISHRTPQQQLYESHQQMRFHSKTMYQNPNQYIRRFGTANPYPAQLTAAAAGGG
ncbi:hypothetical protein RP20_CCG012245 [Aedes albopictus]|nr:hypothetical protein RP20_CCG012245 [Aedes albopictus]